jgi:hypothetical protein
VKMVMREAVTPCRRRCRRARVGRHRGTDRDHAAVRLAPGGSGYAGGGGRGLGAVAMLASYLPALRASRLEPTEARRGVAPSGCATPAVGDRLDGRLVAAQTGTG